MIGSYAPFVAVCLLPYFSKVTPLGFLPGRVDRLARPRAKADVYADIVISDARTPQLLEFMEPKTNTPVLLIGAMHYNPTSISLARDTIESLAQKGELAAVIVESCPIRWNRTNQFYDLYYEEVSVASPPNSSNSFLKQLLYNEMVAASEIAHAYNIPVILGDQLINVTNNRIKEAAMQTAVDLIFPQTGWKRLFDDVKGAYQESLPSGPGYLDSKDFFDLRLLLLAPITLVKYPLALVIKAPISILPVVLLFYYSFASNTGMPSIIDPDLAISARFQELITSFAAFALEVALLSRVFLVTILAERNEVLAKSILRQCFIASTSAKAPGEAPIPRSSKIDMKSVSQTLSKAFGLKTSSPTKIGEKSKLQQSVVIKKVVAVLGMAHCNGIKQLLLQEKIAV
jgi:hypothetical protein